MGDWDAVFDLVVETAHRDGLARYLDRRTTRRWDRLPDGGLFLQESEPDWVKGTVSTLHLVVAPDGERIERWFVHRVYSMKEWNELLREAGFVEPEAFGAWDGTTPATPEAWRLVLRAQRGLD